MRINELCRESHRIAVEKGFWDRPLEFGTRIALIHREVSEALEEHRCGNEEKVGEEMADAVIRIADLCYAEGIDLEDEIARKTAYNKTRSRLHGKNY